MKPFKFKTFSAGRMRQVRLACADDLLHLDELDRKRWLVASLPVKGVRFDARTLELMDTDHDGRIRFDDILDAIAFLKERDIDLAEVFNPSDGLTEALSDVMAREADLSKAALTDAESEALKSWEVRGATPEVSVLGADTAAAEAALAAVESVLDAFFAPAEETGLVLEGPERRLSAADNLNPRHRAAVTAFFASCVKPVFGDAASIGFAEWSALKARFAPFRAWRAEKPTPQAGLRARLEDEERTIRYRLHLLELLENFVNMARLYDPKSQAIFQAGTLRIDARELSLCVPVADEAAHAALAAHSKCCLLYVKLSRPADGSACEICAAVTAGSIGSLYVGRNGVFCDRDGKVWEATVSKVVENQVSLTEAFWAPWRKIGEAVTAMLAKVLGDRQALAQKAVLDKTAQPGSQTGGAALASSVAAVGIGVGMVGAAAASVMAAVSRMNALHLAGSVLAIVAIVSLPSVILTWFKLRKRDIGALLNACGWAVNRPLRVSMRLARTFTSRLGVCD